jgi:8-oxo-dGTP diphosphatase
MHSKTIVSKVFIINSRGLILTLRRSKADRIRPGQWDLPGGGVDYGEDPTDAVVREAAEEAGLILKAPKVFITKTSNNNKYVVRLLYYADTAEDQVTLSSEHEDYKWVTEAEFRDLDIPEYYKNCLSYLP